MLLPGTGISPLAKYPERNCTIRYMTPVHHSSIDELPASGFLTSIQSSEHAERALHPATGVVSQEVLGDRWFPVSYRGDERHGASLRDIVQIMAGQRCIRASLTVAGDRTIDQARVDGLERVIVNAQSFGHARTQFFDQNIGLAYQLVENFSRFRVFQVDADALLVPLERVIHRHTAGAGHLGAGCASLFGTAAGGWAWLLDTDDFGAHVTKNHGTKRPRRKAGEIKNGDSFERSRHAVLLPYGSSQTEIARYPSGAGKSTTSE